MDHQPETPENSMHTAATSPLLRDLWARAHGAAYPAETEPTSSCSWQTLGYAVTNLRLAPDGLLVDLGCGRAGPSLWLARALNARLIGVDLSAQGVALAAKRAPDFVGTGRAEFRHADFGTTGLPDAEADALFSVDALPFAPDIPAVLREAHRILRSGGHLVFSAWESDLPGDTGVPSWPAALTAAGFTVEDRTPHEGCTERWLTLYRLLVENEAALRGEINAGMVDNLIAEATDRPHRMPHRRNLLLTASKP